MRHVKTSITIQVTDEEIAFAPATVKMLEQLPEDETLVLLLEVSAFMSALLDGIAKDTAEAIIEHMTTTGTKH